jgi:glucokinase
MGDLLRDIPVRVVLNDRAALLGAARHGADVLAGEPAAD